MAKRMKKFAWLMRAVLLFACGCSGCDMGVQASEKEGAADYDGLVKACKGDTCCLASVKSMRYGNYLPAPGKTIDDSGCPQGYKPNSLRCGESAYLWCEPVNREQK